jgi:hypothetical protein
MPSLSGYGSERQAKGRDVLLVFIIWLIVLVAIFVAVNYGGSSETCNPTYDESCVSTEYYDDLSER